MDAFEIISPVDGRSLSVVRYARESESERALQRAQAALPGWRALGLDARLAAIEAFVAAMEARRAEFAKQVLWQIGRPLQFADELGRVRAGWERTRALAPQLLGEQVVDGGDGIRRALRREPKGIALGICAWNYPVAMAAQMAIAALAAGNAFVLKHAPQTALIAELMAECADAAGLPGGVFQVLHLPHAMVERLLSQRRFQAVQFIGSERGGRAVLAAASAGLVATGLELGGKDAAYVRADADLDWAAAQLVEGAYANSGQSCCSVERIYVDRRVYPRFVDAFVERARALRLDHPLRSPDLGPVVSAAAAQRIADEVAAAVAAGARAALAGHRAGELAGQGAYLSPEVLLDVNADMAIEREETFGPVATLTAVDGDAQALAAINASRFGLTASVWTREPQAAAGLIDAIQAGTVFVNRCDHADLHLPWGGTKASGLGRIGAGASFDEWVELKSVHVRETGAK
ncbi:aldehyde dehydrogenase family protein [Lysobacter sp. 5GHs7-4]|uniref:aldehyde dehydrogenase family protein n=1 Tax=Lysobacter sp. 5GHs7-4 TaxID=2904253 RepID=UPI001E39B4AB|nr:aldehyde dehydrogenase family protein [Lysobacter sp. 5GHs7-4]UHQ21403.1 aldehyde dehydrogenase family protein [Lysobacter sp. 5GHs7-4]